MALLWTILGLAFFSQVLALTGTDVLQSAVFQLYLSLFHARLLESQKRLRRDILADRTALAATSSQDHFAKWAKLRRKLDKGMADLERENESIASLRLAFALRFRILLWTLTSGLEFILVTYYRKSDVAKLPRLWSSRPARWLLSWPSAPVGSVSLVVWAMICRQTFRAVLEAVNGVAGFTTAAAQVTPERKQI